MNLEIGKYVRYTRSMINGNVAARIAKIVDCSDNELIKIDNGQCILREDIIKARHKIIDLIQQDDLLEIRYLIKPDEYQKEILQVIKSYDGKLYVNAFPKKIFIEEFNTYGIEILSIETKEQFKSEKYKVMNND